MNEYYILKNIREVLLQGFSEEELRQMCFYEIDFKPLYDQLSQNAGKEKIVHQIIEYAYKQLKVDVLLAWVKDHNPQRYKVHKPYYQLDTDKKSSQNFVSPIENNDLGYGVILGGVYREIPLKLAAVDWSRYGTITYVRSGWLYVPQWTESHSIAFFKIHIGDMGAGYIHIVDVAAPEHTIWLETQTGYRNKKEFHYLNFPTDVWEFTWRETGFRLFPVR
jgi:hypothetical protein